MIKKYVYVIVAFALFALSLPTEAQIKDSLIIDSLKQAVLSSSAEIQNVKEAERVEKVWNGRKNT